MTHDPVAEAAAVSRSRRLALGTTASRLRKRLDLRLVASDLARLGLARALTGVTAISTTPRQRKRALIAGGISAVVTVGLRVLYRNAEENISPEKQDGVTPPA